MKFVVSEAQSYENLAEAPEFEQALPESEEDSHDYEEAVPEREQNISDYEQPLPEYEEAIDEQPDYVKVEAEEESSLPPPQYEAPDPTEDNSSTEDYDDIGGEDEEDYDDVA